MGPSTRTKLGCCLLLLLASSSASARKPYVFPPPSVSRNAFTLTPPNPLHKDAVGELQLRLDDRWAVTAGVAVRTLWDDGQISAVTADAGMRCFVLGKVPRGLWLAAYGGFGLIEGMYTNGVTVTEPALRIGALAGGSWVPFWRLLLSASGGVALEDVKVERDDGRGLGHAGLTPLVRLSAGFVF